MRFEKVSFEQFAKDMSEWMPFIDKNTISAAYNAIKLPKRQTKGSAGYDFCTPVGFCIYPDGQLVIPSGIRAVFREDELDTWHLEVFLRSSVGIKAGGQIPQAVSIIDADYQYAENGGDILMALKNTNKKIITASAGDRIFQGIFKIHGLTEDDNTEGYRSGGVGSTGK